MKRWIFYITTGCLVFLLVSLTVVLNTTWGLTLALNIASASLPGKLTWQQADGSLAGTFILSKLEYKHDQAIVAIDELTGNWEVSHLLSGTVTLDRLDVRGIDIQLTGQKSTQATSPADQSELAINLPVNINLNAGRFEIISIRTSPQAEPITVSSLVVSVQNEESTLNIPQLTVTRDQLITTVTGSIRLQNRLPVSLTTDTSYQINKSTRITGTGTIRGDLDRLVISQMVTATDEAGSQVKLNATLTQLTDRPEWVAQLTDLKLDSRLLTTEGTPATLTGKADLQGNLQSFTGQFNLDAMHKATGRLVMQASIESGLDLNRYAFTTQGDFYGLALPEARYVINGTGNLKEVNLTRLFINTLGGDIQGQANIALRDNIAVNADLTATQIDTGKLSADWPGTLSAKLQMKSELKGASTQVNFSLQELQGRVREYPVNATANGVWQVDQLQLKTLEANISKTRLTARGVINRQWDMQATLDSPSLNHLWPQLHGQARLAVNISGSRTAPAVAVNGNLAELEYLDERIKDVTIMLSGSLGEDAPINADITAKGINSQYIGNWPTATLSLKGTNRQHTLTLSSEDQSSENQRSEHQAQPSSTKLVLQGGFTPWQWQGQISSLDFQFPKTGQWQLTSPAQLNVAAKEVELSKLCLAQNDSNLCTALDWKQQQHAFSLTGQSLPLALARNWLPEAMQVEGRINVNADYRRQGDLPAQGKLHIDAQEQSIRLNLANSNEQVVLGQTTISASLDKAGLRATVSAPFNNEGEISGQLLLPEWVAQFPVARDQDIRAEMTIAKLPASLVSSFIQDLATAHGHFGMQFSVSGQVGQPQLRGEATWREGRLEIPDAGIQVRDIQAKIHSLATNQIAFNVTARSGDGQLELTGQSSLSAQQGWPTAARLIADDLEVMNTPEAYILVDSDLRVSLQGSQIKLTGDITVPRARLRPRGLPEGTVAVSRDAVIVSEETSEQELSRWLVTSRISVTLGELVDFDGFGVSGKLRGKLLLIDEPGKLVTGQGEINIVDGIYRLRGQDLNIRRGRMIFANTLIDDPGIDVEAVREINTVTAGVRIKGTLKNSQLSLFSEPSMAESDILSYLIFGHAFEAGTSAESESVRNTATAMGFIAGDLLARDIGGELGLDELRIDVGETTEQTALVMGKYLSPKLYVRYLTGIVESSNIVQIRYQLTRRIQLQTEGGYRGSQSITGGDIFFTFEY